MSYVAILLLVVAGLIGVLSWLDRGVALRPRPGLQQRRRRRE